jgi:tetratricopeptide (TPR) repeat protein
MPTGPALPTVHDLGNPVVTPPGQQDLLSELPAPSGVRFRVVRPHARGGIGQVSLARDEELDREVALKEIQPHLAGEPQVRGRFLCEARLTGRLEHPGIVPVYGMGQGPDGQPYYAMRFIRGQSLKEAIKQFHAPGQGKRDPGARLLELRQLLNRFIAVCNTVAYAHSKGVLHRDLKPGNIMLGPYGETLVVDWGLAKVLGQAEDASLVVNPPTPASGEVQTAMGAVVGTPGYMSPEQASGRLDLLGPASDVYSLGATLYTLLTGKLPFEGPSPVVLECVRGGLYTSPRQVDPRIPAALDAITRKAMALAPGDRYASARDLADDLERWLAHEPVRAWPESWGERLARLSRRHRGVTRVLATAAVIIVVLTGILVAVSRARHHENRQAGIDALNRDLTDEVRRSGDWAPGDRDRVDQVIRQLGEFGLEEAVKGRERAGDACADAMWRVLNTTPVLEAERRKLVEDNLGWLAAHGQAAAGELREELNRRVADWQPVFTLVPPFDNRDRVFAPQRVRVDGPALFAQPPADADLGPLVCAEVGCKGNVQLEATFAPSWASGHVIGLLLNVSEDQGYWFLVSVPAYRPGWHRGLLLDRLGTLGLTLKNGDPVKISIVRNNVVLREKLVPLPADGELRLRARRVGEQLSFQVNQLEVLVFDDVVPLPPALAGTFGVSWPAGAGLVQLKATRQALSDRPGGLEQGDEWLARGKYPEALKFYEQQARQAARGAESQEARFKQALALKELGRTEQALALWRDLMLEQPDTGPGGSRPWPLLAACQVWLLPLQRQPPDLVQAGLVQDRLLGGGIPPEKLAALIPAQVRQGILDEIRLRGPRWRVPFGGKADTERIRKAMQIEAQIDESPFERRMTRWRLSEQHRMEGQLDSALLVLMGLLDTGDLPRDEQLAYVRDLVWIQIEQRKGGVALRWVEPLLNDNPGDPAVLPLLLEKARIHAAEGNWEEAGRVVDDYFCRADRKQQHYADWAEACLLRGFLRDRTGDGKGAQRAWRDGLPRHFPGGLPTPPRGRLLYGVADDRVNITLRCFSQLASLTGEMTEADARLIYDATAATPSPRDQAVVNLGNRFMTRAFVHAVLRSMYQSDRGKDLARRMTLRQLSFKDCYRDLVRLILYEALRQNGYPNGEVPQELDPVIWEESRRVIELHIEGKIDEKLATELLTIWKRPADDWSQGTEDDWKRVAPRLEEMELRVPGAFTLGRRAVVQGRLTVARHLFQEIVERASPDRNLDKLFRRLARAELDKLNARRPD